MLHNVMYMHNRSHRFANLCLPNLDLFLEIHDEEFGSVEPLCKRTRTLPFTATVRLESSPVTLQLQGTNII